MSTTNLNPPATVEDMDRPPYAPSPKRKNMIAHMIDEHPSSGNDDFSAFEEDHKSQPIDIGTNSDEITSRDEVVDYTLPLKRKDTLSKSSDYFSGDESDDSSSTIVDESESRPIGSPDTVTEESPLWLDISNEGPEQAACLAEPTNSPESIDGSRYISPLTLPPPMFDIDSTKSISPLSLPPPLVAVPSTVTGEQPTPIYPKTWPLHIRNFFISLDHHNTRTRVPPREIQIVTNRRTGKVVVKRPHKEPELRTIRKLTFKEELAEEQERRKLVNERVWAERDLLQQKMQIANSLASQEINIFQQEIQLVGTTRHGLEQEMLELQGGLDQDARWRELTAEVGRRWKESGIGKQMMAAHRKQEGKEETVEMKRQSSHVAVGELNVVNDSSDVELSRNSDDRDDANDPHDDSSVTALAAQGFPELSRCPSRAANASLQEPGPAPTASRPQPQYWHGHGKNDKTQDALTAPFQEGDSRRDVRRQDRDEDDFMDTEEMTDWPHRTPLPTSDGPKENWQHIYSAIVESRGTSKSVPAEDEDTWWRRPRNEAYPEKY